MIGEIVKLHAEIDLSRRARGVGDRIDRDSVHVSQANTSELRECAGGEVHGRD